jgi:hypothetical protein
MDELFDPISTPISILRSLSGIWNLEFEIQSYSSFFFFLLSALPSFDAALLDFFCGFASVA